MKPLPDRVKNSLQPNTRPVWWGRRAKFEFIQELGRLVFRKGYFTLFAVYHLYHTLGVGKKSDTYWIGVFLFLLWICKKEIQEFFEWRDEIYVVVQDDANSSGRVYKFWGWLKKKSVNEAITPGSPLMQEERNIWYDIWARLTGEKMVRLKLWSQNSPHVFLEARRIHPDFGVAIAQVRGKLFQPGGGTAGGESPLRSVYDIHFAHQMGKIDDAFAKEATRAVIHKNVF